MSTVTSFFSVEIRELPLSFLPLSLQDMTTKFSILHQIVDGHRYCVCLIENFLVIPAIYVQNKFQGFLSKTHKVEKQHNIFAFQCRWRCSYIFCVLHIKL